MDKRLNMQDDSIGKLVASATSAKIVNLRLITHLKVADNVVAVVAVVAAAATASAARPKSKIT